MIMIKNAEVAILQCTKFVGSLYLGKYNYHGTTMNFIFFKWSDGEYY
jgi:hypothetical protein